MRKILTFHVDYIVIKSFSLFFRVKPTKLLSLIKFFKKHTYTQYEFFVDLVGVDHLGLNPRFEVIYSFLSSRFSSRIFLSLKLSDTDYALPTIVGFFDGANWFEREL